MPMKTLSLVCALLLAVVVLEVALLRPKPVHAQQQPQQESTIRIRLAERRSPNFTVQVSGTVVGFSCTETGCYIATKE